MNSSVIDKFIDAELKDIKLVNEGKHFYLDMTYLVDTANDKKIVHIPRVLLPIRPDELELATHRYCGVDYVKVGWRRGGEARYFDAIRDKEGVYFTETILEEKVHEMTLDEIEKKLGHKVKIVNSK